MSETQNKLLKAAISLAAAGVVFFLPFASWGIQLSPIEIRVIAMFVMAALFWILEPIPIWTTSVMVHYPVPAVRLQRLSLILDAGAL